MINTIDQSLLEITFPLDDVTLQLLVLPRILYMAPDPAQCRHFLRTVLGPFCTSHYLISLDNPAYSLRVNHCLHAEDPGPYARGS